MDEEFTRPLEFIRGAARFRDLVYIIAKSKEIVELDVSHSILVAVDHDNWGAATDTEWDATAIAVAQHPAQVVVMVGEDGDVVTYASGRSTSERLNPDPVLIRNAHAIAGNVFACGMKRQVFERIGNNNWRDISAPFPLKDEISGFEAIDGYSTTEIYAVGWSGEIWQYDGSQWVDRSGDTNLILTSVCCAPDGVVYVAGQQGMMLKGRGDAWERIQWDDEIDTDFWDLCFFGDTLYVATMTALYTLKGTQLVPVDFGDAEITTCFSLTYAEGKLWSIGRDNVASFDGRQWVRFA